MLVVSEATLTQFWLCINFKWKKTHRGINFWLKPKDPILEEILGFLPKASIFSRDIGD